MGSLPSPGGLPNPEIEPRSPTLQPDSLPSEPPGKPFVWGGEVFVLFIGSFAVQRASLVAQLVKNPPAMQETWVQSLGWEGPLEEGMATNSSILAWRIFMD